MTEDTSEYDTGDNNEKTYAKVSLHATRYHILFNGEPICGRSVKSVFAHSETKTINRPSEGGICVYCRQIEGDRRLFSEIAQRRKGAKLPYRGTPKLDED